MPIIAQQPYPELPLPPNNEFGSYSYWTDQITQAEEKRKEYKEKDWDRNVQSYLGKVLTTIPEYDTVTVPKDFANVERKKAELFFQNPDINLKPKRPGLEEAVQTFQAVVNHKLGPEGVDAGAMMTECTTDACMTGLMVSKIGYESFADGEAPLPALEGPPESPPTPEMPFPQPGDVLGLTPTAPAEPPSEPLPMVPNIIYERYFWERVSPAKLLLPTDFHGFNYDRAPWLGFEWEEDWPVVQRRYGLPDDVRPRMGKGDVPNVLKSERDSSTRRTSDRVRGYEIWYRASLYDPAVKHPEQLRYLVLIDGLEGSVRHTDSPYQRRLPNGQFVGMRGFPVHVGALRYVSDTAYSAAEASVSRPQVQELGKSRTQMLLQRDRNVPMRLVDSARIGGEDGLAKLRRNLWQGIIPVQGLDANQPPIVPVPQSHYPPEDFQFNAIIGRDLDEVWAFGPNQRGLETTERKTATEIRNIQQNVSSRLDLERRQVIRFYTQGAEKLGALIQLFADQEDYVEIVGPDGVRRLQAWTKDTIAGEFVYDARPDSAIRVDAAQEFRDLIELYNLAGRDPHVNRVEILIKLARLRNLDVLRFVKPEPPERGPEPMRTSLALKAESLDPTLPNFPLILELLRQAGYQLSPEAIQQAQIHAAAAGQIMNTALNGSIPNSGAGQPRPGPRAEHPGTAPEMQRLSRHTSDRSNELSGPSTRSE